MREIPISSPRPRLRLYLAAGYALFIVYASLSPFTGWQEQGLDFLMVLAAPLSLTYFWFDAAANLLAYLPLGLLLGLALHARLNRPRSVLWATLGGMGLSIGMEYLQMYLPMRNSSNLDMLTNTLGALIGALAATVIAPRPWFASSLIRWRTRMFHRGSGADFGLALVALWMFAQTSPALPMLGNVFISEAAHQPFVIPQPEPFRWMESAVVSLNMLMLGALLLTLVKVRRNAVTGLALVLGAVALAKFLAAVLLLKSWALLLWLNSEAMSGIALGGILLLLASRLPRARLLGLAGAVALAYLLLSNAALDSGAPSASRHLYLWRYGHLLNYNGLAQTIIMIFPLLLLVYLWRIRERELAAV